ncbi:MAG: TRAP transporter small permease [Dehalococcoidales bacterium]|nr:TRAP transporter small permease [Dehalococcoidales bacterium]
MKIVASACRVANYIGAIFIGLMVLLTASDVILRYIFSRPILGSTELTELMMLGAIFPALAWCALVFGHVKVDLLLSRFPFRVQVVVDSITYLCSISICVLIIWRNYAEFISVQRLELTSSLLKVPIGPFYWIILLGYGLFCIVLIFHFVRRIIEAVTK